MIDIKNLYKDYERTRALHGISFSVRPEAFFALLGPNGAGKSTTIEILSTLKSKTAGTVQVATHRLDEADGAIREAIGVVFQTSALDATLTVRENLEVRGAFYSKDRSRIRRRIDEVADEIDIREFLDRRVGTLSGGQRRRADLARALLNRPEVLLLDEPTTGLDPRSRERIWRLVLKLKRRHRMTIVLTTHYMEEVNDCDQVVVLHEGRIVAEDSAQRLRERYAHDKLLITPASPALSSRLEREGIDCHPLGARLHIPVVSPFQAIELIQRFEADIETFEIVKGTMDDVFLNLTGRTLSDHDASVA